MAAEIQKRQIKRTCTDRLINFIEEFWPIVEPNRDFVTGWAIEAICEHLEAVSAGQINRLLMNVPPGFLKSLGTCVFWPAWEWGPLEAPSTRYLTFSYSSDLTERDNKRFGEIVSNPRYQEYWGRNVTLPDHALGARKVANRQTGWKIASSVGGTGTGERSDRVIIDDPHNVKMAESEAVRQETVRWFRESVTSRMNDPQESAIVVIMQRVHEDDVSGCILSDMNDYTHLCIPMRYDGDWRGPTRGVGWTDPREVEGELAFPERYPMAVVDRDESAMGPFATAAQFGQTPAPREGGIIKRDWWQLWPAPGYEPPLGEKPQFPLTYLRVGSIDTAYSEKEESAYNAMTSWGFWHDERERPKVVMMDGWRMRGPLRGVFPADAKTEDERRPYWGLAEKVANTIWKKQLDIVLIENKTRGKDLSAELYRLLAKGECQIILLDPHGDKVARLHAVQALFADSMIYAPDTVWAEQVISEVMSFPRGKYADFTDTCSQFLQWARSSGVLQLGIEADVDNIRRNTFVPKKQPLYDV